MEQVAGRFEFRDAREEEAKRLGEIEQICFPPHEACTAERIEERVKRASETFMVAIEKNTGIIAGFLNGIPTEESVFRDAFFTDISLYDPCGTHVMLLGLDVLPEFRMQGLAREIVARYADRERRKGRKQLILTCLDSRVPMYLKFGFCDKGIADSTWGGEEWHEMVLSL